MGVAVNLSPDPVQSFRDNNGNPLSGGKLFTYAAGTTTKQATYTDSTGTTQNANPVILNSRGEASVWLASGGYKFVLSPSTDSDPPTNPIWTQDNIVVNAVVPLPLPSNFPLATGYKFGAVSTVATTAVLPANTYNNGSSGVGATLTANANGVLTVDGYAVALNDIVIVKNEAAPANNGIYICTTAGAVGAAYVLTRTTWFNTNATAVTALYPVGSAGTANAGTRWLFTNPGTVIFGTTAISFSQWTPTTLNYIDASGNLAVLGFQYDSNGIMGFNGRLDIAAPSGDVGLNVGGGIGMVDTSAAFNVTQGATSSVTLTANRTITWDVANGNRTLKLTGNAVLNQDVSTAGSPSFANVIGSGNFVLENNSTLTGATTAAGIATGSFTQAGATQNTWFTAISNATLVAASANSTWLITVNSQNQANAIYLLTSGGTGGGAALTLTQLATGTNCAAQLDGSGNLQIRQTAVGSFQVAAMWIRFGQ